MSRIAQLGVRSGAFGLAALIQIVMTAVATGQESELSKAPPAPLHFTNAQHRFSILLPPGWTPMPAGLAENFATQASTDQLAGTSTFGFELASDTNTLTSPSVTVQVRPAGRIADGFVRMLQNPEIRRRAVLDLVRKDGLTATNISKITFETNRHRLAFCATRSDDDGGQLRLWQSITFTERGSINVACVADDALPVDWDDTYARVLDSLTIHPSLAYRPQAGGGNVEGAKFRATGVLFVPGIMVLLGLGRLVSRRFNDDVRSDEI